MMKFSGYINCYRFFDIGGEVNLLEADAILNNLTSQKDFNLGKISRALVIEEEPLVVFLGKEMREIQGAEYLVTITGKIWNFGALSIIIKVNIAQEMELNALKDLANFLEKDPSIHELARKKMEDVYTKLASAIREKKVWVEYEDYLIFVHDADKLPVTDVDQLLSSNELYELVLLESSHNLNDQMIAPIKKYTFRYTNEDAVLLDWNSSFILSKDDAKDICDVIEFSVCQLLELRYYDDLLDKELNALYRSIKKNSGFAWKNKYSQMFEKASRLYIEISEVIEKVENSLKLIGDAYYAKIYRASNERLRLNDWQTSVDQKLRNLLDISTLFQSEIHSRKNQLLEIVIIILIAIEVIPLLWNFFKDLSFV